MMKRVRVIPGRTKILSTLFGLLTLTGCGLKVLAIDEPPAQPVQVTSPTVTYSFLESPQISWTAGTQLTKFPVTFEVAIGTSPGRSDVYDWKNVGSEKTMRLAVHAFAFDQNYYTAVRSRSRTGVVSAPLSGNSFIVSCPAGYLRIPKNNDYVNSDFCLGKYEAKQSGTKAVSVAAGTPWVNISRQNAAAACEANGPGFGLTTNSEWQTVARNIEGVAWNWGGVGIAYGINRGVSQNAVGSTYPGPQEAGLDTDPCKLSLKSNTLLATCSLTVHSIFRRVHKLSTDAYLWDFSGNASEYITADPTIDNVNYGADQWVLNLVAGARKEMWGAAGTYPAIPTPVGSDTVYGFGISALMPTSTLRVHRGGGPDYGRYSGIFTVYRGLPANFAGSSLIGFRCVSRPY